MKTSHVQHGMADPLTTICDSDFGGDTFHPVDRRLIVFPGDTEILEKVESERERPQWIVCYDSWPRLFLMFLALDQCGKFSVMERSLLVAIAKHATPSAYMNLSNGGEVMERHVKEVVPKK